MGSRRGGCKRGAGEWEKGTKELLVDINSQVDAVNSGS